MGPYINLTVEYSRENELEKYKISNYVMMIEKLKNIYILSSFTH